MTLENIAPSWTQHAHHVKHDVTCHLCYTKTIWRQRYPIDIDLPMDEERNTTTRIYGDTESICFDTTDHEGDERDPSFEMTWPEIFTACKEYMK